MAKQSFWWCLLSPILTHVLPDQQDLTMEPYLQIFEIVMMHVAQHKQNTDSNLRATLEFFFNDKSGCLARWLYRLDVFMEQDCKVDEADCRVTEEIKLVSTWKRFITVVHLRLPNCLQNDFASNMLLTGTLSILAKYSESPKDFKLLTMWAELYFICMNIWPEALEKALHTDTQINSNVLRMLFNVKRYYSSLDKRCQVVMLSIASVVTGKVLHQDRVQRNNYLEAVNDMLDIEMNSLTSMNSDKLPREDEVYKSWILTMSIFNNFIQSGSSSDVYFRYARFIDRLIDCVEHLVYTSAPANAILAALRTLDVYAGSQMFKDFLDADLIKMHVAMLPTDMFRRGCFNKVSVSMLFRTYVVSPIYSCLIAVRYTRKSEG